MDGGSAGLTSSFPTKKLEDQPPRAITNRSTLDLSIKLTELVPEDQFTAAEIQSYLLDFKDDPDMAVQEATECVCVKDKTTIDLRGSF
jgi:chaperone BCS1